MKQTITFFAILMACMSLQRVNAQDTFAGGDGTAESPWEIGTAEQLAALNNYLGRSHENKYFEIIKDIDLTEWLGEDRGNEEDSKGWWPIGGAWASDYFCGHIEGAGHTISGLWIARDEEDRTVGLLGNTRDGSISNLTVEIAAKGVHGKSYTGGLAGYYDGPLTNCHIKGEGKVSGSYDVGGLAGGAGDDVTYCSSTVAVEGTSRVGGLIGYQDGHTISQSYATGEVTGTGKEAGGLVGFLYRGTIEQCYASGAVGAMDYIGGLVGAIGPDESDISRSYATGKIIGDDSGGLVGYVYTTGNLTLENCFYLKGSGTQDDPWLIPTANELAGLNYFLGESHQDNYFKITKNIDLTDWLKADRGNEEDSKGWWPIGRWDELGVNGCFWGHLDGAGYTVSGLWINREEEDYVGLFGYLKSGSIRNLTVEIAGEGVTGKEYTGGLVGNSNAPLTHCHVRGEGKVSGNDTGGLAGESNGDVSYCSSTVAVEGTMRVGGLIAYQGGYTISQSYATGEVTNTGDESGGLVGILLGGTIEQCYATGAVGAGKHAGGLAGAIGDSRDESTLSQSYATGAITGDDSGGLAGIVYSDGTLTIENCFYLAEMVADDIAIGAISGTIVNEDQAFVRSEAELQQASTFTDQGWEFLAKGVIPENDGDNGWKITGGESMPWLWWEYRAEPADPVSDYYTITLELAPGIWCNYAAGQLTVTDADHLYLQFHPEDFALTTADILFTIDGMQTDFKVSADERSGSYILNPIDCDCTISITLREKEPTGNAAIAGGKVSVAVESGELRVESDRPVDVAVYALSGQLHTVRHIPAGTTRIALPTGVYLVRAGETIQKVIVND